MHSTPAYRLCAPAPRARAGAGRAALCAGLLLAAAHAWGASDAEAGRAASGATTPQAAAPTAAAGAVPSSAQRLEALRQLRRVDPERAEHELDTLVATATLSPEEQVLALELLGGTRVSLRNMSGAEQVAQQLDAIALSAPGGRAAAAAELVRATAALQGGQPQRAERLADDALAKLPEHTPPRERVHYLEVASGVKDRLGKLDDSVALQLQALTLVDASGLLRERAEVRTLLAQTYIDAGQYDRARSLNQEALALGKQAGDDLTMSDIMNTELFLRDQAKDSAGTLAAMQAALDYAHRAHAKRDEILSLANLADYYLKHAEYPTALAISQRALGLARDVRSQTSEALALTNVGLAMIAMHHKAEGMAALRQGLEIDRRNASLQDVAQTYEEMGNYLERAGELKDAFSAYNEYRRLWDEAFHQDQQRAIVELQERFDSDRRQHDLQLLNRQNRLKDEQLLQHQLLQRLWTVAAVLALLSISVVVLLVQRARRANRELASTNELLKVQSERDPLTGLANRRHFQQAMQQLANDGRLAGTIFLLDIDHFKHINDVHGHAAGDAVLVEIARRLRSVLRENDLIVRWGGEEFLAVVRLLSPEQIDTLVRRLLAAVAGEPIQVGGTQTWVSVSIGFATLPLEPAGLALSWERAIELVDTTLYLAKAHGRNRAYGIRLLHAASEEQAMQLARTLEQAWRDGKVALTLLAGPAPDADIGPAASLAETDRPARASAAMTAGGGTA